MASEATGVAPQEWLVLAHLLRPQGRRGEVLAELMTDFPDRFKEDARVFLAPANFAGSISEARAVTVANHWLPIGRNHGRIVLHFSSIGSIEEAESVAGMDVVVPIEERVELEDDSEYITDLIECCVYDRGVAVGRVIAVDFPATPDGARRLPDAAPLLTVLAADGEEILIPYVQSFVVAVNTPEHRIEMNLPEGLLDLNRV